MSEEKQYIASGYVYVVFFILVNFPLKFIINVLRLKSEFKITSSEIKIISA